MAKRSIPSNHGRKTERKPKKKRTPVSRAAEPDQNHGAEGEGQKPGPLAPPDPTDTKIFPRNLTARAAYVVHGNPIVTRPEDAVANCYPGLELDVRNLDRRFFPGLVFNFVEPSDSNPDAQYGAKLAYVDVQEDPDLKLDTKATRDRVFDTLHIEEKTAKRLYSDLNGDVGDTLSEGSWYLEWVQVADKRISMRDAGKPLNGLVVWRLIRGLEPGPVSIGLMQRVDSQGDDAGPVQLEGWRRLFTDPVTGVISGAYQPGELMQGLCSPWQHDFRDCYCHYWASNRPDLVFGDVYLGDPVLPGGQGGDAALNIRLDWMRADRSRPLAVNAFGIIEQNRPYQFDHYQINAEWQDLNIVLGGREIDSLRLADVADAANPFDDTEQLVERLRDWLGPLEMTLVFEYLYARFSLKEPQDNGDEELNGALALAREYLLLICMSEMQHLRWGNEILWELYKAGLSADYQPVIASCPIVPSGWGGPLKGPRTVKSITSYVKPKHKNQFQPKGLERPTVEALTLFQAGLDGADPGWRPRALLPLTRDVQQGFINVEHPSAFIDGAYSQVVATLRQPKYPDHLFQLAQRIVGDGMLHEVGSLRSKPPSRRMRIRAVISGPT